MKVILSSEQFISLWMEGYLDKLEAAGDDVIEGPLYHNFRLFRDEPIVREYVLILLERMYLRNFEVLSKKRPTIEEAVIWIGQENATYGLLITPRFRDWELG